MFCNILFEDLVTMALFLDEEEDKVVNERCSGILFEFSIFITNIIFFFFWGGGEG